MKTCKQCKTMFTPKRKDQIYCSSTCRVDANNELIKSRYKQVKEQAAEQKKMIKTIEQYLRTVNTLRLITSEVNVKNDTITYLDAAYVKNGITQDYDELNELKIMLRDGAVAYSRRKDEIIVAVKGISTTRYHIYTRQNRVK